MNCDVNDENVMEQETISDYKIIFSVLGIVIYSNIK